MRRSMMVRGLSLGLAVLAIAGTAASSATSNDTKRRTRATATLTMPDGTELGSVRFTQKKWTTEVRVRLDTPLESVANDAYHGFHIHANDDPANGEGCSADPAKLANTWFTAVDGHYSTPGTVHSEHLGDMPNVLVLGDGSVEMRFDLDRVTVDEIIGRAVVLHANPDNFGNVPEGTAADQYTPNSPAATKKTDDTGNGGDRLACGIIQKTR
jgi:superoxide dismutase, Cu-Zn family